MHFGGSIREALYVRERRDRMSLMKKKRRGVVRFSSQHLRIADYL